MRGGSYLECNCRTKEELFYTKAIKNVEPTAKSTPQSEGEYSASVCVSSGSKNLSSSSSVLVYSMCQTNEKNNQYSFVLGISLSVSGGSLAAVWESKSARYSG